MSHSKRNTSLAFFTTHERSLLKTHWGTQSSFLNSTSFLSLQSCRLCLLPARSPVLCEEGDIFCRECAVENLVAQRKEIGRLERDGERALKEGKEEEGRREEERKARELEAFEKGERGVGDTRNDSNGRQGRKRKSIDHGEDSIANKSQKLDSDEKSTPSLPSFWIPSLTPSTTTGPAKPAKLHPICPSSSRSSPHPISLKSLTPLHFSTPTTAPSSQNEDASTNIAKDETANRNEKTYICPICNKPLTNTFGATAAIPCGHVFCKPCTAQFIRSSSPPPPGGDQQSTTSSSSPSSLRCFVCDESLAPLATDSTKQIADEKEGQKKKKKKGEKKERKRGLVELRSEGTGFAGKGGNRVVKEGVAFQC
ncbi:MAG: hypothetical protein M1834_004716 [Cirrosporium novae-zelandiae]|nr:MAG: hypothetical protein M1834_004716 [Cirrosporium novae-zelandiae]